jgi:hypothetical protein
LPDSKRHSLLDATVGRIWDAIVLYWQGKHVAVLGAPGVGKSHFIKFLTSGSIPTEYKQTVAPEKAAGRRLQLRDLDLEIKDMLDVGGGTEARGQWLKQVARADIVFYLLRVDQMISNDAAVEKRVLGDAQHIKDWLKGRKPRPALCIVGTHCDNDPAFRGQFDNCHGDYVRSFLQRPVVRRLLLLCGGHSQVILVIGSMKTVESTEELVFAVFKHVMATE